MTSSGRQLHRRSPWPVRMAVGAVLLTSIAPAVGQSVQSITASSPDLGNVVSASTGTTIFRVDSDSGVITRTSGTGVRLSTSSNRPLVTIACASGNCKNRAINVRVGSIGSPSGRAGPLTNFTITAGTATLTTLPLGTNPVDFTMAGLGNGETATFWVGMDFPILGNETGTTTGSAASEFYVYVALAPTVPTTGSTAGRGVANVFRPINIANNTGLAFGRIVRPTSGTGSVSIAAATGQRTVSGTGTIGLASPAPRRATYSVSGEGGQTFSLGIPGNFQMSGPGTPLTVTLTSTASGSQTLSSTAGSAGTFSFGVGGSFPVASSTVTGAYQGSYSVTVQYN